MDTTPDNPALPELPELAKLQIQQSLETFRFGILMWQQVSTVLVIADITIVGYAIANKVAFAFLLGAVFPYILYRIAANTAETLKPIIYTAITLEHRYGGVNADWLFTTFQRYIGSSHSVEAIIAIADLPTAAERVSRLRALNILPFQFTWAVAVFLVLGLAQAVAPIVLVNVFDWRLV